MLKRLKFLALGLALVLPLAACDDDEAPPPPIVPPAVGNISGTALVEGSPIQGATIAIAGPEVGTAMTDASGSYSFTGIPVGAYTATISSPNPDITFATAVLSVTVTSGQTATADFDADYIRTAAIVGIVIVDEEGVQAVPITVTGTEDFSPKQTDANGEFAFSGLRAGDYSVTLDASGLSDLITFASLVETVNGLQSGQTVAVAFTGAIPAEPTVSIASMVQVTGAGAGLPVNPTAVAGVIAITVNHDAGDDQATRLSLQFDTAGTGFFEVDFQTFGSTGVAGLEGPARTPGDPVTFAVNTAEFDDLFAVRFPNKDYEVRAELTLASGTVVNATAGTPLTFANLDVLTVRHTGGGQGLVRSGVRFWGGETINFDAIAIIYSTSVSIAQIGITATQPGTLGTVNSAGGVGVSLLNRLDFGSNPGVQHTATAPPFTYTATVANNFGGPEDLLVLPIASPATPGGSRGQAVTITSVLDPNDIDILPDFAAGSNVPLQDFMVDFVPPAFDTPAASELSFDSPLLAASIDFDEDPPGTLPGRWLGTGVAFSLTNTTELGIGYASGFGAVPVPQVDMTLNVNDLLLVGAPVLVFPDVASSDDLTERDEAGYELEITSLRDRLGNEAALGDGTPGVISTADDVADDNASDEFGVDFNGPTYANQDPNDNAEPSPRVDWDQWIVFNNETGDADHNFEYDVDDPDLADGNDPSGISTDDLSLVFETTDGVTTTTITSGANLTDDQGGAFNNVVDAIRVTVDATSGGAALADGAYQVTAATTDDATDENLATIDWWVVLVSVAPPTTLIDAPPGTLGPVDNASLDVTIKGRVERAQADLNGNGTFEPEETNPNITVELQVFESTDNLCSTTGDNTLFTEGTGDGEVLDAEIDINIDPTTREFFDPVTNLPPVVRLFNTNDATATGDRNVCFLVTSTLEAVDNDNADDDLSSSAGTVTAIDWEPVP